MPSLFCNDCICFLPLQTSGQCYAGMLSFSGFSFNLRSWWSPYWYGDLNSLSISSADAIETVNFNKESWDFLGTLRRSQWRLYMSHAFNLAVLTQWTRFSSTIFSFWWLFCRGIAKSSPAIDLLYYGTAVGQSISM